MVDMEKEITLWAGNIGTRLDKHGNVYSVSRGTEVDKKDDVADIIAIYQSVLRDIGIVVSVEDIESPYDKNKRRVIHTITSHGGILPYIHKKFGYEYIKE